MTQQEFDALVTADIRRLQAQGRQAEALMTLTEGDNLIEVFKMPEGFRLVVMNEGGDDPVELLDVTCSSLQGATQRIAQFLLDEYEGA